MSNKVQAKKQQGNGYFNKKDYQKAKKAYLQALEMDPKHITSLNNLSSVYFLIDDFEKSIQICKRAIAVDQKSKKTYYRITLSFSKLSKHFEVIESGRKYLKLQNEEQIKNKQAIQIIKTTIKQAKDKILNLVQIQQPSELNYFKNPIITTQPSAIKQIKSKLIKKEYSLQDSQQDLKYILRQSLKSYSVQICTQFDQLKRSLYKQILQLEKDEHKKQQIINILLTTSVKEEKKQLLLKKLSLSYIKDQQKIVIIKSLLSILKTDEHLQSQIKELQNKIKKSSQQQLLSSIEQKENNITDKSKLNGNSKKTQQNNKSETSSQAKIQSQHSIHTQITKPFSQLFIEKIKKIQTYRDIQNFFNLFKFINQSEETSQQKLKYIKQMKESTIFQLFAKGAQKSEKNYIKKMCKQLGEQQLFEQLKS